MRMICFLNTVKKYLLLIIVVINTLIITFYNYFPLKIAHSILKIPHIIAIFLACGIIYKVQTKKYKIKDFARKILFLLFLLATIYISVSFVRWMLYGFVFARYSLYLAMSVLFGSIMFFSVDSEILSYKYHKRDTIFIISFLNILQLIISSVTFGGIRASYLLENIMVYNCVVIAFLPQLFIILYKSERQKDKMFSIINIMITVIFVTLSGSRSAAYVIWVIFFMSVIALITLRHRTAWFQCMVMILIIPATIAVLYQINILGARSALDRSFFFHISETNVVRQEVNLPIQQNLELTEVSRGIMESDNMRKELWQNAIKEIKKEPVIGTGITYFDNHFGSIVLQQSAHNVILEIWLVFGGLGLAVYLLLMIMIIVYLLFHFLKLKHRAIVMLYLLSIVSILVLALVQPLMVMFYPSTIYWLLVSWAYKYTIQRKLKKRELYEKCIS